MALLVGERLASLFELETLYSFEDALNMAEVLIVRNYNEHFLAEYQAKKNRLNGN